jgi:hypothetical protein
MGISSERFRQGDVYFMYDYEKVMFRYDAANRKCFRRFVGESEEVEVLYNNRLFNHASLFGDEIDQDVYYGTENSREEEK